MCIVPKFKVHGGSVRENLALQNVQVYNHKLQDLCFENYKTFVLKTPSRELKHVFAENT